jgi:hypothetical protein
MTVTDQTKSLYAEPYDPSPAGPLDASLLAIYSENGEIARTIMEWRHKVVALYVLALGGLGSAGLWLLEHNKLQVVPLLFFAGAILMCFLAIMDNTNATILKACYLVGHRVERRALAADGAVYTFLYVRSKSNRTFTYSRILRVLYLGTAVALTIVGTRFA